MAFAGNRSNGRWEASLKAFVFPRSFHREATTHLEVRFARGARSNLSRPITILFPPLPSFTSIPRTRLPRRLISRCFTSRDACREHACLVRLLSLIERAARPFLASISLDRETAWTIKLRRGEQLRRMKFPRDIRVIQGVNETRGDFVPL